MIFNVVATPKGICRTGRVHVYDQPDELLHPTRLVGGGGVISKIGLDQ